MEAENTLHQISIDEAGVVVHDNQTYPIIPAGRLPEKYRHFLTLLYVLT